ncbi:MAG: hypothetical protein AMJ78_10675 [Omnitrophica WOR_2 bacterium SM23_29]|nr:MAG: hypothetical protein AMJ78_10675 [Omnitrophica WOR_2 bacterium SM23_29]
MLAKVESKTVSGIEAKKVEVEVDISSGLPHFAIVGLADTAVKESRDRVISAIKNSGFKFPPKRITINLAPADIKKEGASFDLPIAIGILIANSELEQRHVEGRVFCGELSLDGRLRPIDGALPIAVELSKNGLAPQEAVRDFILPHENAKEAAIVQGLSVYPLKDLNEVVRFLKGHIKIEPQAIDLDDIWSSSYESDLDFSDVKGQWHVKRGLEVAAAGGHNVLMIGPPGSGKTMLARRLPTVLPKLSFEEALETTKIHSVAGLLRPGEISLAHNGVLFLDELPEFRRDALEALRQPLESGEVVISRVSSTLKYPTKFMLVAAMNPCPCGYFTDPKRQCHCTPPQVQHYLSKISGPFLDRIDIHLEVPSVKYRELSKRSCTEGSKDIRERIERARTVQKERYEDTGVYCNAHLDSKGIERFCVMEEAAGELLKLAILEIGLSARGYDKVLKVARTIADLAGSELIKSEHISEAINYRSLDRSFGF